MKNNDCDGNCEKCQTESGNSSRRSFLGAAVAVINLGIITVIAGPVIGFVGAPLQHRAKRDWIRIAELVDLPDEGATEVTYSIRIADGYHVVDRQYSVYLRREGESVLCIDPACTHLGCRVTYQAEHDRFLCPCHGGVFDQRGKVVSGPPPRALETHQVKVEAGQVWLYREV